jgi:DNA-binding transcriptional LysR family regulator
MELRHLRYFIAVAEELHFARAASRLHIVQPALSKQIQQLEQELGFPLFYRTKQRVELLDAGQILLDEARRILRQAENAVESARRIHTGQSGRLRIGFSASATLEVLPKILRKYRRLYPNVEVELWRSVIRNLLDFDQIVLRECADKSIDTEFILSPPNYEPHLFRDRRETHPEAPGQRECESSLWHKQ